MGRRNRDVACVGQMGRPRGVCAGSVRYSLTGLWMYHTRRSCVVFRFYCRTWSAKDEARREREVRVINYPINAGYIVCI